MEKFDILRTQFLTKGMIPSVGDDVTLLWGRKIVHNTMNSYGLIGTLIVDTNDAVWVNIGLSRIFDYPPEVMILWKGDGDTQFVHNDSVLSKSTILQAGGIITEYWKRVAYYFSNDSIGFRANLGTSDSLMIVYKIHGV